MLKSILKYKFPIILVTLLYFTHLYTKDFSSPYQKPIVGDAKAYYAYLPAIFIYQDSQYEFIDDYEQKYYANNQKKDFLNTTKNGKKVNKTFPGAAILYLPFFLIAHALSLLFGIETDGYSIIYQYLFDFGYWLYLLLGTIYYTKVFRLLKFKNKHIYFSLFILLVGTNMLFYTVVDQSVTHIFNFAMINALIYHLLKHKSTQNNNPVCKKPLCDLWKNNKHLYFSISLLVLIGITRPTNIIILLLIPIFINQKEFYSHLIKRIFMFKNILILSTITLIIGCIPFLLWRWQTGNWIVYSYGNEGFDFLNPEIANFLFSYMKGWFTYTPIALIIIIIGLIYLGAKNWAKITLILFFYTISVYVFSSWWCWYYGAGMGQRVMIDHYILLGFLMLFAFQKMTAILQKITVIIFILLIGLNVVQAYQIKKGIYPMGSPTKNIYWDNFLNLTLKAKVYKKSNWQLIEKKDISFNPSKGNIVKGQPKRNTAENEYYFIQTNNIETYSPSFEVNLNQPTKKIVLSFNALAHSPISESRLVLTTIKNQPQTKVIYLKEFMLQNVTNNMEFLVEFNAPINSFKAYFWNGNSKEMVNYSNFRVESYKN